MFKGPVYKAVWDKVKEKIDQAEKTFEDDVKIHENQYRLAMVEALNLLQQNKKSSLDQAVKSVIK